jgi:hypothetical protein
MDLHRTRQVANQQLYVESTTSYDGENVALGGEGKESVV